MQNYFYIFYLSNSHRTSPESRGEEIYSTLQGVLARAQAEELVGRERLSDTVHHSAESIKAYNGEEQALDAVRRGLKSPFHHCLMAKLI